jgi:hypothetical protein
LFCYHLFPFFPCLWHGPEPRSVRSRVLSPWVCLRLPMSINSRFVGTMLNGADSQFFFVVLLFFPRGFFFIAIPWNVLYGRRSWVLKDVLTVRHLHL